MDSGKDNPITNVEIVASDRWVSVINKIAGQGLKSAAQLKAEGTEFFPSDDEFPRNRISGIHLWPFDPTDIGDRGAATYFRSRLYDHAESVMPVILERPGEKRGHYDRVKAVSDEVIKQESERRAEASFLIVCVGNPEEFENLSEIPSQRFNYALLPEAVYRRYTQDPSAIPFPPNVRVRVIDQKVKRFIADKIDMELKIPNYEQALIEILNSGVKDIFVHGVRLPLDNERVLFKKTND